MVTGGFGNHHADRQVITGRVVLHELISENDISFIPAAVDKVKFAVPAPVGHFPDHAHKRRDAAAPLSNLQNRFLILTTSSLLRSSVISRIFHFNFILNSSPSGMVLQKVRRSEF